VEAVIGRFVTSVAPHPRFGTTDRSAGPGPGEDRVSQTASAEKDRDKGKGPKKDRPNLVARIRLFFRQVVAELRKVIWPTRKELVTYTIVVLVFASVFAALVVGLDLGFGKLNFLIFG